MFTRRFLVIVLSVTLSAIGLMPLSLYATSLPVTDANIVANHITAVTQVGVVLPYQGSFRFVVDGNRIHDVLTAGGYNVTVLYSQNDSVIERTNVEALIAQGMRVLIICPVNATIASVAAEEARAAGVKVISYDRLVRDTTAVDFYITFDGVSVGRAQGQYLVSQAGSSTGHPLYLYTGANSDNNSYLFFEGSWEALQPKLVDGTFVVKNSSAAVALQNHATLTRDEATSIISQTTTGWDPSITQDLAQANLAAVTKADKGKVFILGPADFASRIIGDVFAADADVHSYVITGQDAEPASVQYIIDGKQSMTVFKDIRTLAIDAAAAAITYIQGGTPQATTTYNNGAINVPSKPSGIVTVDKNNLKSALIDSGYYQFSDFIWPVIPKVFLPIVIR